MSSASPVSHIRLLNRQGYAPALNRALDIENYVGEFLPSFVVTGGAFQRPAVAVFGFTKKQHSKKTSFGFIATNYRRGGGANTCRGTAGR